MATSNEDNASAYIRKHIKPLRDKQNFEKWSEDMEIELGKLNCWKLITGAIIEPTLPRSPTQSDAAYEQALSDFYLSNAAYEAWERKNAQARWSIYFNCEETVQKSIKKFTKAAEIWAYLQEQLGSQPNVVWWSTVRSLETHTLASNKDCTEFAGKIRRDWTTLKSAGAEIPEWRACAQLIYHLGDTYQHFVLNELSKTPLKDQKLERFCGALFAKEARLHEQSQGLSASNATRSRTRS